jgi:hypothetical protein
LWVHQQVSLLVVLYVQLFAKMAPSFARFHGSFNATRAFVLRPTSTVDRQRLRCSEISGRSADVRSPLPSSVVAVEPREVLLFRRKVRSSDAGGDNVDAAY